MSETYKNYEIDENHVYDEKILALTTETPANAETKFNPLFLKIINNVHSIFLSLGKKSDKTELTAEKNARTDADTALSLRIDETRSIAEGRNQARVFATYAEMTEWLTVSGNKAKLNIGDNLYIITRDVPDYWWDGTQVQVLETEKVDLTEYFTKEQVEALLASKASLSELESLQSTVDRKESLIKDVSAKTTLADADTIPVTDSADNGKTKKITWENIKTDLKSYNPNILINGNFQIRQDGNAILINPNTWTFTADMVRCKGTGTVTVETGKITFSNETNAQYIADNEDYSFYNGKTVTLSYSKNGIIHVSTYTINSLIFVNLNFSGGDILNWWKLELGSISTPFIPNPISTDLALCMRYNEKSIPFNAYFPTSIRTQYIGGSWGWNNVIDSERISFAVEKRTTPTITLHPDKGIVNAFELWSYYIVGTGYIQSEVNNVQWSNSKGFSVRLTVPAGTFIPNNTYFVQGHWQADARNYS